MVDKSTTMDLSTPLSLILQPMYDATVVSFAGVPAGYCYQLFIFYIIAKDRQSYKRHFLFSVLQDYVQLCMLGCKKT